MIQSLIDIFEEIGLPYIRQGTLSTPDDYPLTFFTYWNIDLPRDDYGDNEYNSKVYDYMIYCYSYDGNIVYSKLSEFIEEAESRGWVIGSENDAPSDRKDYCGRMVRIKYKEERNNG